MPELTHEDLSPEQLQALLAAPGAPALPEVTPPAEHDVATGPVDNGQAVDDDDSEGDQSETDDSVAQGETPDDPAPPQVDPDEYERTPLEDEVKAFTAGEKRIRLTGLDPDGVAAVLVAKRNPDGPKTLLDALVQVKGREEVLKALGFDPSSPVTPANSPSPAEPTPPVDPVAALQAEIDSLVNKEEQLIETFELEEAKEVRKSMLAKQKELTALMVQSAVENAKPAAPQISDADFQRLFEADRDSTLADFPDLANPDSPLMKEMTAEHARMAAAGDPAASAWNVNSVLAAKAAAKLNLQPRRASSPAAVSPARSVPRPVHGTRSAAPPKPVDEAALKKVLTPHMLAGILNGAD